MIIFIDVYAIRCMVNTDDFNATYFSVNVYYYYQAEMRRGGRGEVAWSVVHHYALCSWHLWPLLLQ